MSDRRRPVKAAFLLAPLVVSILALHAWGEALAGGLSRAMGDWQYPERDHAAFRIRVPRRSDDADAFAARALEEFVSHAIKAHGTALGLQPLSRPVRVVMLDLDTDVRRFGWTAAEPLVNGNDGLFDAKTRTIYVRMERKLQQEPVIAALRQAAARALLHDAGSAGWSVWLTEGLVGRLEEMKPGAARPAGDLPSLKDLLTARDADFRGIHAAEYARGARLFVSFLMDAQGEEFAYYYRASREGVPPAQQVFDGLFPNHQKLETDWKHWIQLQR